MNMIMEKIFDDDNDGKFRFVLSEGFTFQPFSFPSCWRIEGETPNRMGGNGRITNAYGATEV